MGGASCQVDGCAIVLPSTDLRVVHVKTVLKSEPGDEIRIGVVNGRSASATISGLDERTCTLTVKEWGPPPVSGAVELLLAMPRPKSMRRLWSILGQLGLSRIYITNASKVERFYFDSQSLHEGIIEQELMSGAEQSGDTRIPRVSIHKQLKRLLCDLCPLQLPNQAEQQVKGKVNHDLVERLPDGTILLLAHPHGQKLESVIGKLKAGSNSPKVLLAVGPEGGWTDFEVDMMVQIGFIPVSMGPRPLRTDVAVIALLTIIKHSLDDW